MPTKNKETIEEPIQEELKTPLEKEIEERQNGPISKNQVKEKKSPQATPIKFNFASDTLADEEDMSQVKDILNTGEEEQEQFMEDVFYLSVEDVARFLKGTYDAQGWVSYPELWKRDFSFFMEIAEGILPNINSWAQRVPAVGHAIRTVSAAGSWGRLIWDMAGTWILIQKRKKLEAEKKQTEGEQTNEPVNKSGIFVP